MKLLIFVTALGLVSGCGDQLYSAQDTDIGIFSPTAIDPNNPNENDDPVDDPVDDPPEELSLVPFVISDQTDMPCASLNAFVPCDSEEVVQGQDGLRFTAGDRGFKANGFVIEDSGTGLQYSLEISPTKRIYNEAVDYCASLNSGDQSDWRLPHIMELYNLIHRNSGSTAPQIDRSFFPNFEWGSYWTERPSTEPEQYSFTVSFYTYGWASGRSSNSEADIICVRGDSMEALQGEGRFELIQSRVIDMQTGLQWQNSQMQRTTSWREAGDGCAELELDDQSDWRLPSIRELMSIARPKTSASSIEGAGLYPQFLAQEHELTWSGTPDFYNGVFADIILLDNATGLPKAFDANRTINGADPHHIRCVRSDYEE